MILLRIIELLFRVDIKSRFAGPFSMLFDVIMALFSLTIYWYTSKVFMPSVDSPLFEYKQDYFSFIVLGEIILAIPFYFVDSFVQGTKSSMIEGVYETLSLLPVKYKAQYWMAGMLRFPRELLRVVIQLICAILFFKLQYSMDLFTVVFPLVLLSIPAFVGIGYFFISVFIITGRGSAIAGLFNTLLAFSAGAFFPLSLLPEVVQSIGMNISPFTLVLETSRQIIANTGHVNFLHTGLKLVALNLSYCFFGILTMKYAIKKIKETGPSWTITG